MNQRTPESYPSKDGASNEELAVGARLYHVSAIAAHEKLSAIVPPQYSAHYPVLDNLCHSVELSLKSYLKSKDVPFEKRDTHSIRALYDGCKKVAAERLESFPSIETELLGIINDMNVNKVFRYGEKPERRKVPLFDYLNSLAIVLLNRIAAPTLRELGFTR